MATRRVPRRPLGLRKKKVRATRWHTIHGPGGIIVQVTSAIARLPHAFLVKKITEHFHQTMARIAAKDPETVFVTTHDGKPYGGKISIKTDLTGTRSDCYIRFVHE